MSSDRSVEKIARRQGGLVTRQQAIDAGITPRTISGRLGRGAWLRLYPSVYLISPSGVSHHQEMRGALLWAGDDAVLSHRSAATLLQLPGGDGTSIDVTAPRRLRSLGTTVNFHYSPRIGDWDSTVTEDLRHCNVIRTLADLCEVVPASTLEDALDEALRRRLTTLPALRLALAAPDVANRPGTSHLRSLVAASDVTESPLERMLLKVLRYSDLPPVHRQYELKGRGRKIARLDFAFPEAKVAIECDGYRWHSEKSRWQSDIDRRNFITGLGWKIIQVTATSLRQRPHDVIDAIESALLLAHPGLDHPSRAKKYRQAT